MVNFDAETHTYTNEQGRVLISTTQLLKLAGIAPNYDNVNNELLQRASEYGTIIHKDLEYYIKNGVIGISDECINFDKLCKETGIKPIESELLVNNDFLAGTIDLIYKDKDGKVVISDFKTTSTIHTNCVSWQLSIYKYLYQRHFGVQVDYGTVIHFNKDGSLEVVNMVLKNDKAVEKLFEWYFNHKEGEKYRVSLLTENQLEIQHKAVAIIKKCEQQMKKAQLELDLVKDELIKAMKENGLQSYKDDEITISIVSSSVKKTVDTKKLKKDFPEIYEKCSKDVETKESVRFKLTGEGEEDE